MLNVLQYKRKVCADLIIVKDNSLAVISEEIAEQHIDDTDAATVAVLIILGRLYQELAKENAAFKIIAGKEHYIVRPAVVFKNLSEKA